MDTEPGLMTVRTPDRTQARRAPSATGRHPESLSARREKSHKKEKEAMGVYFSRHDFLVADGESPEGPRETVASVFTNQGTTVNIVVRSSLDWIRKTPKDGPFTITWFTTSALVPATLRRARELRDDAPKNDEQRDNGEQDDGVQDLWAATRIFLFPGEVDQVREVVHGPHAVDFARNFDHCFSASLLGAQAFDLDTGDVYFHYPHEVDLQVACAKLYAARKFLFLDASKFHRVGKVGYSITELLETSESVTLYTCAQGDTGQRIRDRFQKLREKIELDHPDLPGSLKLRIVGMDSSPTHMA